MVNRDERIHEILDDYVKPDAHPAAMERVHRLTFDDSITFHTWDDVKEEYIGRDWDQSTFDRFIQKTQQVVDGGEKRIPESYFEITEPESLTIDAIVNELNRRPFKPDVRGKEREGFKYSRTDDGEVRATYVFVNENKSLTGSGEVNKLVSETSVTYRIDPSDNLLIVESTYPPNVQRTKKIFRKYTTFDINVLGSLTSNYSEADERLEKFLDSFERKDLGENNE